MVNALVQKPYPEKGKATMSPDLPVLGGTGGVWTGSSHQVSAGDQLTAQWQSRVGRF